MRIDLCCMTSVAHPMPLVRVDVEGEPPIRLTRVQSGMLDETHFSSGSKPAALIELPGPPIPGCGRARAGGACRPDPRSKERAQRAPKLGRGPFLGSQRMECAGPRNSRESAQARAV